MAVTDYTIATLGSHSSLQILKGARMKDLRLYALQKGSEKVYKSFELLMK